MSSRIGGDTIWGYRFFSLVAVVAILAVMIIYFDASYDERRNRELLRKRLMAVAQGTFQSCYYCDCYKFLREPPDSKDRESTTAQWREAVLQDTDLLGISRRYDIEEPLSGVWMLAGQDSWLNPYLKRECGRIDEFDGSYPEPVQYICVHVPETAPRLIYSKRELFDEMRSTLNFQRSTDGEAVDVIVWAFNSAGVLAQVDLERVGRESFNAPDFVDRGVQ